MVTIQIVSLACNVLELSGTCSPSWLAADKKHIGNYSFGMFEEQSVHAPCAFVFTLLSPPLFHMSVSCQSLDAIPKTIGESSRVLEILSVKKVCRQ